MSEIEKGVLQSTKTFGYEWKIERFFADCKRVGDSYTSPVFSIHCNDKVTNWYLMVFPKGQEKESENNVSLYFYFESENNSDAVTVDFCLSIANGHHRLSESSHRQFEGPIDNWGWETFVPQKLVKYVKNKILIDDTLTILCVITFCDQASTGKLKDYDRLLDNIGKGLEDYETLLESSHFSDVIFSIQDNKIHLHKAILMCRNSVFKAMFGDERKKKKQKLDMEVVTIMDVAFEVMKEVFRFIYSGKVKNIDQMAKDLLIAADKYDIPELKALCEKKIYNNLTVDNAIEYLKLTDVCNTIHLKTLVMEFIAAHCKEIVKKPGFTDLDKQMMHQIIKLITEKD